MCDRLEGCHHGITCWTVTFALSEAMCSLKLAAAAATVPVPVPVPGNLTGAGTAVLWGSLAPEPRCHEGHWHRNRGANRVTGTGTAVPAK